MQDGNGELIYYIVCMMISVVFATAYRISKLHLFKVFFISLSFLVLFIMYGLRDVSGIDDRVYEAIFYDVQSDGWLARFKRTGMEPGYLITNRVLGFVISDYIYFQAFFSFITLYLFYKAILNYQKILYVDISIFLLFCMLLMQMQSTALVRIFFAMSIVVGSLRYLVDERDQKKYVYFILFASFFHYSAIFLIFLVYFIRNEQALRRTMLLHYVILAVIFPALMYVVSTFVAPKLGVRYEGYANSEFDFKNSALNTLPVLAVLMFGYYKVFSGQQTDMNSQIRDTYKILLFIYALSLLIGIFGSLAGLGRLIFYSYVAFVVLVPILIKNIRNKWYHLAFIAIFILYGYLYVYRTQFVNEHHLLYFIPVHNIFFSI